MIMLSVIIPVYNVEDYLAKCLDSVLLPGEPMYEIIVVDDGSTDSSPRIADEYQRRFPELIRVIHTENMGLGSARNNGMAAANGDFFYFLDSDDYLAPGGMRGILDALKQDFDICIFDSVTVDPAGRELAYVHGSEKNGFVTLDTYPGLLLQIPNVWNKIFRRRLFEEKNIRFPGRAWFEDIRTVLKLYTLTDSILCIPEAWHRYLLRPGSITNSRSAQRNLEIIEAMDDLTDFYTEQGRFEALRDELEYLAFYCQFLTSAVRANLADRHSPVQEELLQNFLQKWPDFQKNPYVQKSSPKHKLLTQLLLRRMRLSVYLLMRLNRRIKYGS